MKQFYAHLDLGMKILQHAKAKRESGRDGGGMTRRSLAVDNLV